jgi:hypothetical protein
MRLSKALSASAVMFLAGFRQLASLSQKTSSVMRLQRCPTRRQVTAPSGTMAGCCVMKSLGWSLSAIP